MTTAPLSALSIDKTNVRKTGRGAEPIFTGSIRKRGVIEALLVRQNGKGFTITNGSKRLDALAWLRDNGGKANGVPVTDDYAVPIKVLDESDEAARETSLIANIARVDTHPVDLFERFAELVRDGANPEDIAATYGMKQREVDQALALGELHPKIRDAWRRGEIRAENAQTFTLTKDQKVQARVFEKLAKSNGLNSRYSIRQELKAEDQEIGHLLTFIGLDAYEARGGKVTALDLFEGKHVVSDTELAGVMAKEKLAAECERLVAAGWGWAATDADLPNGWSWKWGKINPKIELTAEEQAEVARRSAIADDDELNFDETDAARDALDAINEAARARAFGPKQMAKSGCAVAIGREGQLEVKYGILKADNAKVPDAVQSEQFEEHQQKAKAKTKAEKKEPELSQALEQRLSVTLTQSAAKAIALEPELALSFALAGLLSDGYGGSVVQLKNSGMGSHKQTGKDVEFADALKAVMKKTPKERMAMLAEQVGAAFTLDCRELSKDRGDETPAVINTINAKAMNKALRDAFDRDDYFGSVSKEFIARAVAESMGEDHAAKVAKMDKGGAINFAVANVPATWLPEPLRAAGYDGPQAKAVKKAAPAKSAKKAAKRKAV